MALGFEESSAPLPPVTLVLGGARSGKSRWAERLVERHRRGFVYIATASAGDAEMAARIKAHRDRRGSEWRTVETTIDLPGALVRETDQGDAALVDCLTLWLSNLMEDSRDPSLAADALIGALAQLGGPVVFVANELGLGIVPDNPLARAFRDHAGQLNQRIAEAADQVYFIAAGLAMRLK
jgi:adenosylcobinamide kinase/adenosylcobinamide-phosphate guanylyltransferase